MLGYSKRIDKQECSCTYLKMKAQLHKSIEIDHSFLFLSFALSRFIENIFFCASDSGTISQYLRLWTKTLSKLYCMCS